MRAARTLLALALAGALLTTAAADAELSQEDDLIVSFDGGLAPTVLPRSVEVPVAVRVAGEVKAVNGSSLPQLRTISVAINRAGRLFDKGLAVCRLKSIQSATEAEARTICPRAIVGSGHVRVEVHIPTQAPFTVRAKLLAFNGPRKDGRKLILAQVYTKAPPGTFVLTFSVADKSGLFGTVLSTTLPKAARSWAYLTQFDMTLERTYTYRGKRRSYISAACRAPAGFPGAVFPFAKASYGFDDGRQLRTTAIRSCKVAR
jgi:hypothetical protein